MLYVNCLNSPAIRRENEKTAIQQLEFQEGIQIRPSGIFIDKEYIVSLEPHQTVS